MKAVYVGDNRVFCINAFNMPMYVDGRDISLAPHIIRGAVWEEHMTNLIANILQPGMTFVDVGANCGWFSLVAARCVGHGGKIVAVEANSDFCDLVATNLEINGYQACSECWNVAAWDEKTTLHLHVMRKHKGSSSVRHEVDVTAKAFNDSTTQVPVEATTLDALIDGRYPVHFVKIDAEGAEPNILRGMRQTVANNPGMLISIEFAASWYPDGGAEHFLDEVAEMGYQPFIIGADSKLIQTGRGSLLNNVHNDLLLLPKDMDTSFIQ